MIRFWVVVPAMLTQVSRGIESITILRVFGTIRITITTSARWPLCTSGLPKAAACPELDTKARESEPMSRMSMGCPDFSGVMWLTLNREIPFSSEFK